VQSPTPWTYEEMTTCIVIRAADGTTVCNLPKQADTLRRLSNAQAIIDGVNGVPIFIWERFTSAAGLALDWKIDCDALTDGDWDCIARACQPKLPSFGRTLGVPTGGLPLARALSVYARSTKDHVLLVDDVWTTGKSMMECARANGLQDWTGVVAFARAPTPQNVFSFAQINVT
jgi:hypothetical protein